MSNKTINQLKRADSKNYRKIFLSNAPMIDLRAPCEFEQGAFPRAINLPVMSDYERKQVGICYKSKGQEQAIKLGYQLVQGELKTARVNAWMTFAQENSSNGFLYCFRGGLRSKISQNWLLDAGIDLPLIEGGYKAMRTFLIAETERITNQSNLHILTGLAGSAKTKLILKQGHAIDLEGLANHRGSSFGNRMTPQPSQINFENNLSIKLLKHENNNRSFLLLEDESRLIGARSLPLILKNKMDESPLIMIKESFEYRVEQIFADYVVKMTLEFNQGFKQEGINQYRKFLIDATKKIKKRLGGVGLKEMLELIEKAILFQLNTNDLNKHKDWIVYLLQKYYDPMYEFQITKKQHRIVFKGNTMEVQAYLDSL